MHRWAKRSSWTVKECAETDTVIAQQWFKGSRDVLQNCFQTNKVQLNAFHLLHNNAEWWCYSTSQTSPTFSCLDVEILWLPVLSSKTTPDMLQSWRRAHWLQLCLCWAKTDNLPKTSAPTKRSIVNLLASIYKEVSSPVFTGANLTTISAHNIKTTGSYCFHLTAGLYSDGRPGFWPDTNSRTFSTTLAHPDGSGLPGGQCVQPH